MGDAVADFSLAAPKESEFAEHGSWQWLSADGDAPSAVQAMTPHASSGILVSRLGAESTELTWPNFERQGHQLAMTSAPSKQRAAVLRWTSAKRGTFVIRGLVANTRVGPAPKVEHDDPTYDPNWKPVIGAAKFLANGKEQFRHDIRLNEHHDGGFELTAAVDAGAQFDIWITLTAEASGTKTSVIAKVFDRRPVPAASPPKFVQAVESELEKIQRIEVVGISPKNGVAIVRLPSADRRSEELIGWDLRADRRLHDFQEPGATVNEVLVGPNERYATTSGSRGEQHVWDLQSGKVVGKFAAGTYFAKVRNFSSNSQFLLMPTHGGYLVCELRTGNTVAIAAGQGKAILAAAFAPESSLIYLAGATAGCDDGYEIRMVDVSGGYLPERVSVPFWIGAFFRFTPDGTKLVGVSNRGRVLVLDPRRPPEDWVLADWALPQIDDSMDVDNCQLTNDGKWLLLNRYVNAKPVSHLAMELETGAVHEFAPWSQQYVRLLDDRTVLLSGGPDDGAAYYDIETGHRVNRPKLPQLAASSSPTSPPPTSSPTSPASGAPLADVLRQAREWRLAGENQKAAASLTKAAEQLGESRDAEALELLRLLGDVQRRAGQFAEAERVFRMCAAASESSMTAATTEFTFDLRDLGETILMSGDVPRAVESLRDALKSRKQRLGERHPAVADAHLQLGNLLLMLDQVDSANEQFLQCVDVARSASPPAPQVLAAGLSLSARTLAQLWEYDRATSHAVEGVKLQHEVDGGKSTPQLADALRQLSYVYYLDSKNSQSVETLEDAMRTMRESGNPACRELVLLLQSWSHLMTRTRQRNRAEVLLRDLLDFAGKVYGENHYFVANIQSNLAANYLAADLDDYACTFQRKAMDHYALLFGDSYPNRAAHLLFYGVTCDASGHKDEEVARIYEEARELAAGAGFGGESVAIDASMNLATMYSTSYRAGRGRAEFNRAMRLIHDAISDRMPKVADRYRVRFVNRMTESLGQPLAMAFRERNKQVWVDDSAEWALNFKGLVSDVLAKETLQLRDAKSLEMRQVAQDLRNVREQMAAFSPLGAQIGSADEYDRLRGREDELSAKIREAFHDSVEPDRWRTLAEIRERLGPDEVLIEISRIRYYDVEKRRFEGSVYLWMGMRYVAWVIPPANVGTVELVDLGPAPEVEGAISNYLSVLQQTFAPGVIGSADSKRQLAEATGTLTRATLGKLPPSVRGFGHWLICPDHLTWLVPWHALRDQDGRYLIQSKNVTCLTTSRTLVTPTDALPANPPAIVANPNFNLGVDGPTFERFGPLPGTAREAVAVEPHLKRYADASPLLMLDSDATEERVKSLVSPRVLLLSTHGFYESFPSNQPAAVRCGLALAGANHLRRWQAEPDSVEAIANANDGILTGLEVTNMNLRNTELVVLSACESGLGDISTGEGVAGLRQAFQQAGAKSVVASLWPVPDDTTATIMASFFKHLGEGDPPALALRKAQLTLKEELTESQGEAFSHPVYWAPFVVSGPPGSRSSSPTR